MPTPERPEPAARLTFAATALAVALLGGCQSTPPGPDAVARDAASSVAVVRALGFTETADGGWLLNLSESILFDVNSDELRADTKERIARMAQDLLRAGVGRLRVEGHTDNYGTRAHNLELSRRRAEAVAQAFVAHGFPPDAVERRGLAFDFPIASNASAEGRARNRRVAVMVAAEDLAPR
jgi:outer membrane protein OmpA-like peptidoglycan-associated protein